MSPSFEFQPALHGDLVELRPLQADDYDALYAVASDPLIWEQHPNNDRHEAGVFREFFREALASGGARVVSDARTGKPIGSSRYHAYDPDTGEVEIGWTFLARSYWGGRYNAELKRLMLDHAFRFVSRVVFVVDPSNHRSQRAVQKLGGVRTGSRRDASGRECYVFQLTASDWARRAPVRAGAPARAGE
jgi:RimJ/RimL family protein N-acetyltransferase